ncbi:unnamed protein product, partial [Didymodactylos carnosus]
MGIFSLVTLSNVTTLLCRCEIALLRSALMEEITKLLGCKHITVSLYHPEANGQCERFNATSFPKILALTNEKRNNWDDKLKRHAFKWSILYDDEEDEEDDEDVDDTSGKVFRLFISSVRLLSVGSVASHINADA